MCGNSEWSNCGISAQLPPAVQGLRVAARGVSDYMRSMSTTDTTTSRYTLDVQPSATSATNYQWAIHDRGKLIQRSDRLLRSAADARKRGEEELQRILHPRDRQ